MHKLELIRPGPEPFRILALGAHCDDIEIGCGGSFLRWLAEHRHVCVEWVVFSGSRTRAAETRQAAEQFLQGAKESRLDILQFRDGYFPSEWARIKDHFESLKQRSRPDLVLTHYHADQHQDHRIVSELTWNTFRDHLVLEYEIPKYDPESGTPNFFVCLNEAVAQRKTELLRKSFPSQASKTWFDDELFLGQMRTRGVHAGAESRYAEAFHARQLSS